MKFINILITGYGVCSFNGENNDIFIKNMDSSIKSFEEVDFGDKKGRKTYAGRLDNAKLDSEFTTGIYRKYPRTSILALNAFKQALTTCDLKREDFGNAVVLIGSTLTTMTDIIDITYSDNPSMFDCARANNNSIALSVSSYVGTTNITSTLTNSCSTGVDAIFYAKLLMEAGFADIAIVGGTDANICDRTIPLNAKMKFVGIGKTSDDVGSPFDFSSNGFTPSEGSSLLILETEERFMKRNGNLCYGAIENVYINNDAVNIFQSDPKGTQLKSILVKSIGNRLPSYINSQALGLCENDTIELQNYYELTNKEIPITSIKGVYGHSYAASAGCQIIASLVGMKEGFIPKTYRKGNYTYHDGILFEKKHTNVDDFIITSHGYGGTNGVVRVGKYKCLY
ncbi:hypothetical protein BHU72_09940 [Desulfuribacillus stibiiarsenatis]|uniref:Ketosynthase family 3 (KS3) domain-containing protein n=1 Tax=Desulfuribacillus stibiiarsenatis TaxID=1390249 RepID=A0A1E5L8U0_9FIRM|nr:beta-ketoacyl synthase N-terminal-like domain-containing protein [Desulfuribacillus stibiiarsenatis]OEH86572.1 hypothetical protein BHU72_09940 [Desulfuribacillus stibiiarsenatis]